MKRKDILLIVTAILLIAYMLLTDPFADNSLLADIPYGIALVFMVKIFLLSILLISLVDRVMDIMTDNSHGVDEKILVERCTDSTGAGLALVARAIRYLAAAIIVSGVLQYTSAV